MSLADPGTQLDLLDRLKDLRDALPESSRLGICSHVLGIHPTSEEDADALPVAMRELFKALGYDGVYPITGPWSPGNDLYLHTEDKWSGWQREARIKLIDECIAYLEIRI